MALTLLVLMALALVWLYASKPQPIKVRRNVLRDEDLDSYRDRRR